MSLLNDMSLINNKSRFISINNNKKKCLNTEQVAFSFRNKSSAEGLEQEQEQDSELSSKFSSCSSFDISPIHSGRSTPLQFHLDIEQTKSANAVKSTEVENTKLN